ncbi:hypothetical protein SSPO_047200 [Streptomyces antimycoticus]|uniref:Uncharacterized protein n=1 Tax=Streptomyces antimycoticus TaxID=68175 RepID=A0A499UM76_9ACTN|nr:hypothetical protein SSPO_047200 [Streptomyces antimycoticus]
MRGACPPNGLPRGEIPRLPRLVIRAFRGWAPMFAEASCPAGGVLLSGVRRPPYGGVPAGATPTFCGGTSLTCGATEGVRGGGGRGYGGPRRPADAPLLAALCRAYRLLVGFSAGTQGTLILRSHSHRHDGQHTP